MTSETAKREQRFKRSKARHAAKLPAPADFNSYSYDDRSMLAAECAYKAVRDAFAWLSLDNIVNPPRSLKDAQLARQIAVRIMAVDLDLEQRHVTRMQSASAPPSILRFGQSSSVLSAPFSAPPMSGW